jgi:Protein of unknown function, DUF547
MKRLVAFTILFLLFTSNMVFAFDHSYQNLNNLLSTHVVDGLVDYESFKADQSILDNYLKEVSKITTRDYDSWSNDQQLTFLINLYNATTIKLIIDHYPIDSIRDIGNVFKGPWKQNVVPLFGKMISLDRLEHKMIRKEFDEPRIHFALVCAAMGCPRLLSGAYQADKIDRQLENRTATFITNSLFKNRYDPDRNILYISPIFKWYKRDFVAHSGSIRSYIKKYIPKVDDKTKIIYTEYDWGLNEQ